MRSQPVSHPPSLVLPSTCGQIQARRVSFCLNVVKKPKLIVEVPVQASQRMTDIELGRTVRRHGEILLGVSPPDSSKHWAEWQGARLEHRRQRIRLRVRRHRELKQRKDGHNVTRYGNPLPTVTLPPPTTTTNDQNFSSLSDPVSSPSKPLTQDSQYVTHGKGQQSLDVGHVNGIDYALKLWQGREPWSLLTQDEQAQKALDLTDGLEQDLIRRVTSRLKDYWVNQPHQKKTGAKKSKSATMRWISAKWRRNIPWAIEDQAKARAAAKAGVTGKAQAGEERVKVIAEVDHSQYYYPGEEKEPIT